MGGVGFSSPASPINKEIKQVTTPDSSTIYYLDHQKGVKKAYTNEKAFLSYGNSWSEVEVVRSSQLEKWPNVHLVTTPTSPAVYYIRDGEKALIPSWEVFQEQGFHSQNIVTINSTDLSTYNTVAWKDMEVKEVGGGSIEQGELKVELGDNSPESRYLPLFTEQNMIASYELSSVNGTTRIRNLQVKMEGVYDKDLIKQVHIKTIGGDDLHLKRTLNKDRKAIFHFYSSNLVIPKGEERKIGVYVDLARGEQFNNNSFRAVLKKYDYIGTSSWVSGDFPLQGNSMKVVPSQGALPEVKIKRRPIFGNTKAVIGTTDKVVARYSIEETSGNGDVEIKELVLEDMGDIEDEDIDDVEIRNSHGDTLDKASMKDEEIRFRPDDLELTASSSETFTVVADINSGEGRTLDLAVKESTVVDKEHGYNLSMTRSSDKRYPLTIEREGLGVFSRDTEVNDEVFSERSGTLLGVYEIRTDSQQAKLETITFSVSRNGGSPSSNSTLYLVNYNTGEVLNYINAKELNNNNSATLNVGEIEVKPNKDLSLAIVADIPAGSVERASYQTVLEKISYESGDDNFVTDEVNKSGERVILNRSDLYIYNNSDWDDTDHIKGEDEVKLADFNLEAGAGEDIKIRSLTLQRSNNVSGSISYDNGFSNLRVEIDGDQVGSVVKQPYSDNFTFRGFEHEINNGSRAEVEVYVDTEKDLNVDRTQLILTDISATGADSGMETKVHNSGVSSSPVTFGELSAEIRFISSGEVSPNKDDNFVGAFEMENTGDGIFEIENMILRTSGRHLSYSAGYSDLVIRERSTGDRASDIMDEPVAGANNMDMRRYDLEAGKSVILEVYVDTDESVEGGSFNLSISEVELIGKETEERVTLSLDSGGAVEIRSNSGRGDTYTSYDPREEAENSSLSMSMPIDNKINYEFHDPDHPFSDQFQHNGLDIDASQGTDVKAAADGEVVGVVDTASPDYNYIIIRHNSTIVSEYGHLSSAEVTEGETVSDGEVIGESGGEPGTRGAGQYSTGPHLHFEVRVNGVAVDPMNYL